MKTLLVDDESKSISTLKTLLGRYCPEVEIIGEAGSVTEAVEKIKRLKPALVFMDVLMPDGTGFDVLEQCKSTRFDVIFISAFEEHSLRAFRFSALDYLLKPVNFNDLKNAVARFSDKNKPGAARDPRIAVAQSAYDHAVPENMVLPSLDGFSVVRIADIVRCEADSNYTTVYFTKDKPFLASRSLSHFEELLTGMPFVRIHHKHLINLAYIKKYHKGRGGYVEMADGQQVEVSVRKKEEFLERMAGFARGVL